MPKYAADQRRRRSNDPQVAMRYQLEQVMDDFDLDACLIADASGSVVASPDGLGSDLVEALARAAAACTPNDDNLEALFAVHLPGRARSDVMVREFRARGRKLFVAAVGEQPMMREMGSYRTIFGVRRIQAEASSRTSKV